MASYLPKDSANSSPYAEGGGLYAIGTCIYIVVCMLDVGSVSDLVSVRASLCRPDSCQPRPQGDGLSRQRTED